MLLNFFYQYLQTLKPSHDEKDREDGKTPENRDKNNDLKILPGIYLCLTSMFFFYTCKIKLGKRYIYIYEITIHRCANFLKLFSHFVFLDLIKKV